MLITSGCTAEFEDHCFGEEGVRVRWATTQGHLPLMMSRTPVPICTLVRQELVSSRLSLPPLSWDWNLKSWSTECRFPPPQSQEKAPGYFYEEEIHIPVPGWSQWVAMSRALSINKDLLMMFM